MKNMKYVLFALIAGIVFEGVLFAEWHSTGAFNLSRRPQKICPEVCSAHGGWSGKSQHLFNSGKCDCNGVAAIPTRISDIEVL